MGTELTPRRASSPALQSTIEFTIHLQAYIELCRARSLAPAIAYAKKNLSPATVAEISAGGSAQMEELSRAMALLAYPPDTTCRVYQVRLRVAQLTITLADIPLARRNCTRPRAGARCSHSFVRPSSRCIPYPPSLSFTCLFKLVSPHSRPPSAVLSRHPLFRPLQAGRTASQHPWKDDLRPSAPSARHRSRALLPRYLTRTTRTVRSCAASAGKWSRAMAVREASCLRWSARWITKQGCTRER